MAILEQPTASATGSPQRRQAFQNHSVLVVHLVIVAGVLAAWRAASTQELIDELIFGKPSGVWGSLLDYLGSADAWASMRASALLRPSRSA